MNPERWREVDRLFHSALQLTSSERSSFVERSCKGDELLRREVEALLAAHDDAGPFMESPALNVEAKSLAAYQNGELIGQTLGHYRILSQIGVGGMGTVYLAHDSQLGRKVALKMLPAVYTTDQERVRRFQQEARAASALNHPNIVTIYEIGQVEGKHFIATEFIDGETLGQRIRRQHSEGLSNSGPGFPLNQVLNVGVQVADALAAAHAKQIVHRDIKPDNIILIKETQSLRGESVVKLVDFGIAKLSEDAASAETDLATRLLYTREGMVIGTASYMSPEQARGDKVDARTDIWSLGVVLYEMLSNSVPFEGDTAQDVIASILKEDPPPLPAHVPERLKWIVGKALRKNRDERYQTARELFVDLRELQREGASESLRAQSISPKASLDESVRTRPDASVSTLTAGTKGIAAGLTLNAEYIINELKRNKLGVLTTAAVLFLTIGALAYGLIAMWRPKPPAAKVSSNTMKITRLTDSGNATSATISPDGNYVAYVREDEGKVSLSLKQVGQATEREIVSPMEGQIVGPTFSPDGSLIYYVASRAQTDQHGVLYQIPTLGGSSRKVSENVFGKVGLSSDGKRLAFIRSGQGANHIDSLIVANFDGTGEQELVRKEGQAYLDYGPAWSPDDKTIVCGAAVGPDFLFESIVGIPLGGGPEQWITRHRWSHISNAVWLGDGSGLMVLALENHTSEFQLWHVAYPGGEVERVTNDLNGYLNSSLSITPDSSAIVAAQADRSSRIWVAPIGEGEDHANQLTTGKFDGLNGVAWTPDGKILCVLKTGDDSNIWLMNRDGTERKQLTADSAIKTVPQMSPDRHYIVFASIHGESKTIWRMDADGSNQKQLTNGAFASGDDRPWFTPDSRWVIFTSGTESGPPKIQKVSIEGGEPVPLTDYPTVLPTVSPDGKLIAVAYDDEQQITHLAIIPIIGGRPTKLLPFAPNMVANAGLGWTQDSSTLLYALNRNGVSNIWSQPINGDPPKQLTNFNSGLIFRFALSADGRNLVLARGTQTRDIVLIRGFR